MNVARHLPKTGPSSAARISADNENARRKRTRNRAGKQDALIQAALKLFATKGYEATKTREIAAAAGCAEGLIHRYFHGKAGLLTAIIEDHYSAEIADLDRQLQAGDDLESEFVQMVLWEVERFWERRDFLKVFIPRAFVDPAAAAALRRAVILMRAGAILERLQRYKVCTRLPQDEVQVLAQAVGMLGLVFGFMRPMVLGQDRSSATQTAALMAKLMVRSVLMKT